MIQNQRLQFQNKNPFEVSLMLFLLLLFLSILMIHKSTIKYFIFISRFMHNAVNYI